MRIRTARLARAYGALRAGVLVAVCAVGVLAGPRAQAQSGELNCTVSVNYQSIGGTEYNFLGDLERDIFEYVNDRAWTELYFEEMERINCGMIITLRAAESLSRFQAEIVVTSSRPIYGTNRSTNVLAVSDSDWTFEYNRGQPLIYDPNQYNSLTSLLDFYVFLILGYDFDTFEELGGTPYFEQAREIADRAAGRGETGWLSIGEDRSRTALVRQILDQQYLPLRRAYFLYHFGALDRFTVKYEEAWAAAYEAIENVYSIYEEFNQLRYALDVFLTVKSEEIVGLFRESDLRTDLYDLLVEMNPSNVQAYDGLVN